MRKLGVLVLAIAALLSMAGVAAASSTQLALIEDDSQVAGSPSATLDTFRSLGAQLVRQGVQWGAIAPAASAPHPPAGFNGSDPASYPPGSWTTLDQIAIAAAARGLSLELTIGGPAPLWARGAHPRAGGPASAWEPSASAFGSFVKAVATRYSGGYVPAGGTAPLPRVGFWEIWNEPNFGPQLAPQAVNGSRTLRAPLLYRGLVDAAWTALRQAGHGRDTIMIGALAARGASARPSHRYPQGLPGPFAMTKPGQFIRVLYCVDAHDRPLRAGAARASGCPTGASSSRGFRRAHPGLFDSSGISDHPYPFNLPPTKSGDHDPDFTEFSQLPSFGRELDRIQRAYGVHRRVPLYVTEYGYITHPPDRGRFVSPTTAATYINWAEYLSWRNPRLRTTAQYLLEDPNPLHAPEYGGFASGLRFYGGAPKPSFDAYRLPLFLPASTTRKNLSIEVWGCVRPAHYAVLDTSRPQSVQIQFAAPGGASFATLRTVPLTDPHGYLDVRMRFSSSGSLRLAWSDPSGTLAYSRVQRVTVK